MTQAELKQRIIARIQKSNDMFLLEELSRVMDLDEAQASVYPLGKAQIDVIGEAQEQIEKGDFKNAKDADSEIDEWLAK